MLEECGEAIPEGCTELEHPALAQRLAGTTTLWQLELASLLPQGIDAHKVVRVGVQFLRPVPLGQVEWLGGPQHDHARVGFRIEPQVLAHTRKYGPQEENTARIRLKDWQKLAPALQKELGSAAEVTLAGVRAGTVDAGRRCGIRYGTETNLQGPGWHRLSDPENATSVEQRTGAMNKSSSSERSHEWKQRYEMACSSGALLERKTWC